MNFDPKVQIGDIVLRRTYNYLGWFVRHFFPKTLLHWRTIKYPTQAAHHNGIVGVHNNIEGVFESHIGAGFVFTPWTEYVYGISNNKYTVKIARLKNIKTEEQETINHYLNSQLAEKIQYDNYAILALVINIFLKKHIFKTGGRKKWYCVEVISKAYDQIENNFLIVDYASPLDIEKAVFEGRLVEISQYPRQP